MKKAFFVLIVMVAMLTGGGVLADDSGTCCVASSCTTLDQSTWKFIFDGSIHTVTLIELDPTLGTPAVSEDGGTPVEFEWSYSNQILVVAPCKLSGCFYQNATGIFDYDCGTLSLYDGKEWLLLLRILSD